MPLFTVIVFCRNAEKTLTETLSALRAQTCTDWEAICVDDGSTDATASILEVYAHVDGRFRIFGQDAEGRAAAWNRGAAAARGEMLFFLSADEGWTRGTLAAAAERFTLSPDIDVVMHECRETRGAARRTSPVLGHAAGFSVRRDAFLGTGGFDRAARRSEVADWLLRAASCGLTHAVAATGAYEHVTDPPAMPEFPALGSPWWQDGTRDGARPA